MGTWPLYDTYNAGDTRTQRMIASFTGTDGVLYNRQNQGDPNNGVLNRGPFFMKYAEDPNQMGEFSGVSIVVYRYADVLMSWAEAQNHLNHAPDAKCWDYLLAIRDRANAGAINQANYATEDSFDDLILAERLREFPVEGLSRQDLIRHRKFDMHTYNVIGTGDAPEIVNFFGNDGHDILNDPHYKLPLPASALKDGKGKILQNPGY